jgi:hypothetical protein
MGGYDARATSLQEAPPSNRTIVAQAARCHKDAMDLSHRLHDVLERLRLQRPAEVMKGQIMKDSGHVTLEGTMGEALEQLSVAHSVLSEIENYV